MCSRQYCFIQHVSNDHVLGSFNDSSTEEYIKFHSNDSSFKPKYFKTKPQLTSIMETLIPKFNVWHICRNLCTGVNTSPHHWSDLWWSALITTWSDPDLTTMYLCSVNVAVCLSVANIIYSSTNSLRVSFNSWSSNRKSYIRKLYVNNGRPESIVRCFSAFWILTLWQKGSKASTYTIITQCLLCYTS